MDVLRIAEYGPATSAVARATSTDAWITPEVLMLREIEHRQRILVWQQTKDGSKGRNAPKPLPLTESERRAAKPEREKYDAMTTEEARRFLGWDDTTEGR